jgi:hypothetical protein
MERLAERGARAAAPHLQRIVAAPAALGKKKAPGGGENLLRVQL